MIQNAREVTGGTVRVAWGWLRLTAALVFLKAARDVAPANVYGAAEHPQQGRTYLLAIGHSHLAAAGTIIATANHLPAALAERDA